MSFSLINRVDGSIMAKFEPGMHYTLDTSKSYIIDTLSTALLRHDVYIQSDGPVLLVRIPGVFLGRTLMVDQGPVEDGEITTAVFNFGTERIRVEKGEAVSWLLAL